MNYSWSCGMLLLVGVLLIALPKDANCFLSQEDLLAAKFKGCISHARVYGKNMAKPNDPKLAWTGEGQPPSGTAMTTDDLAVCVELCQNTDGCSSISFNAKGICKMKPEDLNSNNRQDNANWVTCHKDAFSAGDGCDPDPCNGVGACLEGECVTCSEGYSGDHCEIKDPCLDVVCKNEGTCTDGACTCAEGFIGTDCGTEDLCFGVNCLNGGACSEGACACVDGYTGDDCSVEPVVVPTFAGNAGGANCVFPFTAYNRVYYDCTTEKKSSGNYDYLWCATTSSYDEDKKWGKCPGCVGDDSCCNADYLCGINEGDCDSHSDCKDGLVCEENNCNGPSFQSGDDCCSEKCVGGDSCCVDGICGVNEGDCDSDSDCKDGLVCGTDNCVGDTFQSSDDCCKLDGCNPNPCKNEGVCSDGVCTCPDGFGGDFCEKVVVTTFAGNADGAACALPFNAYGRKFDSCTTEGKSASSHYDFLWCSTTEDYDVDKKWGKCPGCVGGDSCCDDGICGVNEGDCDYHSDCKEGLICGENNCDGPSFQSSDDCCTDQGCKGGDSCCVDGICGVNEGDCDSDSDCKEGLVCGIDNCVGDTFQSSDDCCKEDPCYNDPCKNGGECFDGDCVCPDGFAGDTCETPVVTTFSGNAKGAPCVFPWIGYGRKYDTCTTQKKSSGHYDYLWCATTSSYDADKKWGKCPGCVGDDSCCDSDYLCGVNEGDCDDHSDCKEGLICGENNCVGDSFQSTDDCCTDQGCKGGDSCCVDGICGVNEGDCDRDSDCQEGLVCGTDNCVGDTFQSSDDCCKLDGCNPNPCLNGGTCDDGVCSCPKNFAGDKCEKAVISTFSGNAGGAHCVFPWEGYYGVMYDDCTTKDKNGGDYDYLWCATTSSYLDDGKWGKCPGCVGGDSCCKDGICGINEGDCDSNSDCKEGLVCGENNCDGDSFQDSDDCCTDQGCNGGDSCCVDGICGENEGDCDSDSDCKDGLFCGKDNCVGDSFQSTDDCCTGDCVADVKTYTGTASRTTSGKTCQAWAVQTPHGHSRDDKGAYKSYWDKLGESAADAANYCRDPDNTGALWCYTTDSSKRWEYCGVPKCPKDCVENIKTYKGKIAVTKGGLECQAWSSQTPHRHSRDERGFKSYWDNLGESAADAANYCRDPDNSGGLWCYTTTSKRWDYCEVPKC